MQAQEIFEPIRSKMRLELPFPWRGKEVGWETKTRQWETENPSSIKNTHNTWPGLDQ
jgi:hypothetical protein